jgi:hypothetical protein
MTIVNKNKIIALFMGGITSEMNNNIVQGFQNIWLPIYGICNWTTINIENSKILEYHKSWDWLIPVIDKITSMEEYIEYKNNTSNIISDGGIFINTRFINDTYNDVINFINWYNENQNEL